MSPPGGCTDVVEHLTRAASEMVSGLKGAPVLLALILLNMMMVGGALWFLRALSVAQAARFDVLMKACMGRLGT
jgi:hypothetical protein